MPPYVSRKRSRSPHSDTATPPAKRSAVSKPTSASKRAKPTLFETFDAPKASIKGDERGHKLLHQIDEQDGDEDDSSDVDSDDFEDVPAAKRKKVDHNDGEESGESEDANEDDDDEDMQWHDAVQQDNAKQNVGATDLEIGDVSISVREDGSYVEPLVSAATGKKGPSKRERHIRVLTHSLHVQTLLWHNFVRNSWLNDQKVQTILLDALPEGMKKEVTRWKRSMGMLSQEELDAEKALSEKKAKGKNRKNNGKKVLHARDWGYSAEHANKGAPNLSHGDPMLRLLKVLTAYWRKRFTITAPGLRKRGYMPLRRLRDEVQSWEKNKLTETHGERVENLAAFRELAKTCEGSRDIGAQLFVALLRAVGLEVRLVANIQPAGFGWSKSEEANADKSKANNNDVRDDESEPQRPKQAKRFAPPKLRNALTPKQTKKSVQETKSSRQSARGNKSQPINLEESDSSLSSAPSDIGESGQDVDGDLSDDPSVVDVTPVSKKRPTKKYDRDLPFPIYWAEVLSPLSHRYIPVDAIVLSTIASNEDLLQSFEPRGSRADKAKQVMCYTIAYNADGSAKDVTVRYLKRHQLPGKTKGMRMPIEKVPIYNRHGKVKKYEEYDWFRELMLIYEKPQNKRTKADGLEDDNDLKPFKPSKEEKPVEKESLAWYKASAEFVLEPHLRREEALLPNSKLVKTFTTGKGDKVKDFPVFRRSDVVNCKTVESWHKEGRELKPGEQPLKYVPMRAVTLQRKREIEDAQRETGEKMKQGLYSEAQTDWIIPPPIENGVIPKNAFGNMDVYVPTMVPKGAVHLPLRGSAKICKRLGIEFAEACTGFEFGKQRAVPVLTGVVVAAQNKTMVRDAWRADQAEAKRKEDTKRTAAAMHWWRKMLMGLRILERMRIEYADSSTKDDETNPFARKVLIGHSRKARADDSGESGGGFLTEQHEEGASKMESHGDEELSGGFLLEDGQGLGGGFLVEETADSSASSSHGHAPITPVSLQSMHKPTEGEGEEDSGHEHVNEKVPVKARHKQTRKVEKRSAPRRKPSGNMRQPRGHDLDESEIDDASSLSENDNDELDDYESGPERASPKVVITPQRPTTNGRRTTKAKVTSTRSPYFEKGNAVETTKSDKGDSDTEQEVVNVRATTARTRARK